MNRSESEIEERVRNFEPHVIGVSNVFSAQAANADRICRLAKRINPRIVTVMGGAHVPAVPKQVLKNPDVDFAVIGEGKETLSLLLSELDGKYNFTPIGGLGYRGITL